MARQPSRRKIIWLENRDAGTKFKADSWEPKTTRAHVNLCKTWCVATNGRRSKWSAGLCDFARLASAWVPNVSNLGLAWYVCHSTGFQVQITWSYDPIWRHQVSLTAKAPFTQYAIECQFKHQNGCVENVRWFVFATCSWISQHIVDAVVSKAFPTTLFPVTSVVYVISIIFSHVFHVSLQKVVEEINRTAFVTSPYPVILSIENHCCLNQQRKVAEIFEVGVTNPLFITGMIELACRIIVVVGNIWRKALQKLPARSNLLSYVRFTFSLALAAQIQNSDQK